jgi:CP family cyanate transporter-like MFS transporter
MSQSVGYFLAAIAPLLMGVIFEITLNWNVTLIFIVVLGVIQLLSGFVAGKPGKIKY